MLEYAFNKDALPFGSLVKACPAVWNECGFFLVAICSRIPRQSTRFSTDLGGFVSLPEVCTPNVCPCLSYSRRVEVAPRSAGMARGGREPLESGVGGAGRGRYPGPGVAEGHFMGLSRVPPT